MSRQKSLKQNGFTLVEILIVLVVIGVLAVASIPSLIRTRLNSNEAVVQKDLTSIASAMEIYRSEQNPPVFPVTLSELRSGEIPLIDSAIAAGMQHGYNFIYSRSSDRNGYTFVANPIQHGATGNRSFCVDHGGVLKEYTEEIKAPDGNNCPANESLVMAIPADEIEVG